MNDRDPAADLIAVLTPLKLHLLETILLLEIRFTSWNKRIHTVGSQQTSALLGAVIKRGDREPRKSLTNTWA
jgi:hypothetical protein